jgi:hypothetical protein
MKNTFMIGITGILLSCGGLAQAADITFTSDANIQTGDLWSNVSIYDSPPAHTTVNMTGGLVNDILRVCNASTFNMSAGQVVGGALWANDQSKVNIFGNSVVGGLSVYSNATVNFSGNASVAGASTGNSGILNVYGGIINQFTGYNSSVVNVYGGIIGTTNLDVGAFDTSVFTIYGGVIDHLSATDSSTINLRGGNITNWLGASSAINVFGYDLAKTDTGGTYGYGQVTGFWQNGSPFTIDLRYSSTYSAINLVPEPATLLLFGVGTFLLRKSKRKIQK